MKKSRRVCLGAQRVRLAFPERARLTLFSLFAFVLPTAVVAAPSSPPAQVTQDLARASVDQQNLSKPAGRLALVRAAGAFCEEVGRIYPRNSPREEAWLAE